MPFEPVDINNIKMDSQPDIGNQGFAPVDINSIKLDQPDPVDKSSETEKINNQENSGFGQGLLRGAAERVLGTGQLLNDVGIGQHIGIPSNVDLSGAVNQSKLEGKETGLAGTAGEILGDPLNYIPMGEAAPLAKIGIGDMAKIGAKYSAVSGATAGEQSDTGLTNRALNTVGSTATGAILGPMMGKASQSIISPNVSKDVQTLIDNNVPLTPGAIIGGFAKRAEDAMTSVPIIGDIIKYGQKNSIQGLNNAALNRALTPIGEKLPDGIVGRDAVQHISDRLDNAYEQLLPKLNANVDGDFIKDIKDLHATADSLPPQQAAQFKKLFQTQIVGKMDFGGTFDGKTLKGIESELGAEAKGYSSSPSWDDRKLGGVISDLKDSLRELVSRTSPENAKELKNINTGYANYVRIRKAAAAVGAKDGVFSPNQLQNAVKASDKSVGKGSFAKGNALMQNLSDPASNILPSSIPDSGTATRGLYALTAGAGAATLPYLAAKGLAAGAAYSKPGMKAAEYLLARRPDVAPIGAAMMQKYLPRAVGTGSGPEIDDLRSGKSSGGPIKGKLAFKLKSKDK